MCIIVWNGTRYFEHQTEAAVKQPLLLTSQTTVPIGKLGHVCAETVLTAAATASTVIAQRVATILLTPLGVAQKYQSSIESTTVAKFTSGPVLDTVNVALST